MIQDALATSFTGRKGALFGLSLRTGVLTVLTLGIYRFWMKTRLRRYFWSSIRPGGVPLEYVGQGVEKLLGFLIAVVILAFYIGVVNLILMFASLSIFEAGGAAYAVSFIGVIPIWFYATYRARRYVLARTRWRGIRFGLDPGAWGYAWRAMIHWAITILSVGLLWPRMTFWLEKYIADRTWYGDRRLEQGGKWTMLYRAAAPLIACILVIAASIALMVWSGGVATFLIVILLIVFGPLLVFGLFYYRVKSFELLTNTKRAGDIGFEASPRVGRVIGIYFLGNLVIGFFLSMIFGVFIFLVAAALGSIDLENIGENFGDVSVPLAVLVPLTVATYLSIFLMWQVLRNVFITQPLWAHYAETLTVVGATSLATVRQRARDEHTEAEGFAEALDLGAAI